MAIYKMNHQIIISKHIWLQKYDIKQKDQVPIHAILKILEFYYTQKISLIVWIELRHPSILELAWQHYKEMEKKGE